MWLQRNESSHSRVCVCGGCMTAIFKRPQKTFRYLCTQQLSYSRKSGRRIILEDQKEGISKPHCIGIFLLFFFFFYILPSSFILCATRLDVYYIYPLYPHLDSLQIFDERRGDRKKGDWIYSVPICFIFFVNWTFFFILFASPPF